MWYGDYSIQHFLDNLDKVIVEEYENKTKTFYRFGKVIIAQLRFSEDTVIEDGKIFYNFPNEFRSYVSYTFKGKFINKKTKLYKEFEFVLSMNGITVYNGEIKDYYPSSLFLTYLSV